MTLGERLKALRVERGLSQPELAERVGIEQSYLSKVENDKSIPSDEIFSALQRGLNVSIDDIMIGFGNKKHLAKWMQVEAIALWVNDRDAKLYNRHRQFLMTCYCFVALGLTFFYSGFSKKIFPEQAFEYISMGVIAPEEPDDLLKRWEQYQLAKTREDSLNAQRTLQPRLDEKREVYFEYQGSKYHRAVGQERRVYWFEGDFRVPRRVNGILEALGVLLFILGIIGVVVDKRHLLKTG